MKDWYKLILVALSSTVLCESANILAFYPYPAPSHHLVYWPFLKELAKRGHNVTMFSPLRMPDPPSSNYREITIQSFSTGTDTVHVDDSVTELLESSNFGLFKSLKNSILFMNLGEELTHFVGNSKEFQWLIKSDSKFDLILGEWTFSQELFSGLHHRFNAINVELTSFGNFHWTYFIHGQPFDASYVADTDSSYSDHMDFGERLQNTLQSLIIRLTWYYYYMPQHQVLMDTYIQYPGWRSRPGVIDLLKNTSLVLMNTHYSLNYPYPNSPHFKEIGGLNIQSPKPLPKDLQTFMDEARDGVIFFSLGSVLQGTSVLKKSVQQAFLKVFSALRQRVIWKWESKISNLPRNIKIGSWFPQQSILAHKNCKLFITHAGFLSLTETVDQGVPVVAIPMWADQMRNAKQMTSHGYAVQLGFNNLTQQSISWAINQVLTNPRYKQKAMVQSKIFHDKPETALETAVYWTEYVLRHKGAHHLKPAISTMPWYQQAMIDVYAAILLIILIPIYIMYKIIKCFIFCICFRRKNIKKKKKQE